jgi:hypothetical protein
VIILERPDCMTYPCREECCSVGADVWPEERERMIAVGVATADEFTGPLPPDECGDVLYRTALGARGCVFLNPQRGCRLHTLGYKPEVCQLTPRDPEEVEEMAEDTILPCRASWRFEA